MLLLLPVRQAGSGTKSGLREKNQGLKFFAFPVVLPATSITIASVKEEMAPRCESYTDIYLLGFNTISIAVVASHGAKILDTAVAKVVRQA